MKGLTPLVLLMMLGGCMDQDPFGLSRRSLGAGYQLEAFMEGGYFIHRGGNTLFPAEHLLEGSVAELGVSDRHVLALRQPHLGGDEGGWMVIDKASHEVSGPLSREMVARHPLLRRIEIRPASEAFGQLPPTSQSLFALALTIGIAGAAAWRFLGPGSREKRRAAANDAAAPGEGRGHRSGHRTG
jgi:hypothetical protein